MKTYMRVSEFKIGRGEVYLEKYSNPPRFVEILGVRPYNGGRWLLIADHDLETDRAVPGSERIHFGAKPFLQRFRPATAADFDTEITPPLSSVPKPVKKTKTN